MDERDWLVRQLKQLLEFVRKLLARVQALEEAQDPARALDELGAGYRELFGLEPRYLPLMTAEAVRRSLGSKAREAMLADLLQAEVRLRRARGETGLADRLQALADALGDRERQSEPDRDRQREREGEREGERDPVGS